MTSELVQQLTKTRMFSNRLGVIVGAGRSGLAAARLLRALGASVRVVDEKTDLGNSILEGLGPDARLMTGPLDKEKFEDADIIVVSPGVPVRKIREVVPDFPERKIISELELSSWFADEPIIAITGTNGKTTTTSLISHVLEYAGKKVFTGGNIGTPLSEYILSRESCEALILEVSSFQLQNCRLFKPDAAILLNISANHLDYHLDMAEYLEAKLNIFSRQTAEDLAIVPADMRDELGGRNFTRAHIKWFDGKGSGPHGSGKTGTHPKAVSGRR